MLSGVQCEVALLATETPYEIALWAIDSALLMMLLILLGIWAREGAARAAVTATA